MLSTLEKGKGQKLLCLADRNVKFRTANVTISKGIVTAVFNDGKVNELNLNWMNKHDYRSIARDMGYRENWVRYGIEHELAHHFIADKLGMQYSWAVHTDVQFDPPWPDHIAWEEHLVNSFQRYTRTSKKDKECQLDTVFGDRLEAYSWDFANLCLNNT